LSTLIFFFFRFFHVALTLDNAADTRAAHMPSICLIADIRDKSQNRRFFSIRGFSMSISFVDDYFAHVTIDVADV